MNSIVDVFGKFETKDWITLVASLAALVVSVMSFRQKTSEGRLALRKQLTDLLEKLTDLNTKIAKFHHLRKTGDLPAHYPRLLNDQRRLLVRQAASVAEEIRNLVNPYEYLLMAGAFDGVDDIYQAEAYFNRAASGAHTPLDRGIAIRGYARFLFVQNRKQEGRERYAESLKCFLGDTDRLRHFRGDTYERWAAQEREWGDASEANHLFSLAIAEFQTLSNPARRQYETDRVRDLISEPKPGDSHAQPSAAADAPRAARR